MEEIKTEVVKKPVAAKAPAKKAAPAAKVADSATEVKSAPKKPAAKKVAPKAESVQTETVKVEAKVKAKEAKGNKVAVNTNRLEAKFKGEVSKAMVEKFNYKSIMQVPHLEKVVINIGVGEAANNPKVLDEAVSELAIITGQHPVTTKSKKSIANFKLRENVAIGCKVTLRGERMYAFFDKLVTIALPRVRDFRGISKNAFDGRGNYTLGVKEQLIFPEIDYDKVTKIRGMDIVVVTTAKTDEEAFELLKLLGMPFATK